MADLVGTITALSSCTASLAAVSGAILAARNNKRLSETDAKVTEVHTLVNASADQRTAELDAMTAKRDDLVDAREEAHFRKSDAENAADEKNGHA